MKSRAFMLAVMAMAILSAFIPFAPLDTVSGYVRDENGNPIEHVTVMEKGLQTGVVTNDKGFYKLKLKTSKPVLNFSALGYATKTVTVGNKSNIDVVLKAETATLDEVVVSGYMSTRKKEVTASMALVTAPGLQRTDFY
ncbi:MAG: carboxypeptidase-like regulatory domain-containing protein, partial [Chitinophagaceae bacterium]|nr:carboxypeptidase-like regulatory domain-containing protein [Chitinophagaceae bacterium]